MNRTIEAATLTDEELEDIERGGDSIPLLGEVSPVEVPCHWGFKSLEGKNEVVYRDWDGNEVEVRCVSENIDGYDGKNWSHIGLDLSNPIMLRKASFVRRLDCRI